MNVYYILLIVLPAAAYLVGAVPFGYITARLRGIDIRQYGSGNVGATNVGRVLGLRWGLFVFVLDVLKGLVSAAVASGWARQAGEAAGMAPLWQTVLVLAVAGAAIIGHIWPVYLGFKGGKGVATSLGAVLGVWPFLTLPGLAAFATWAAVLGLSRYVSLASVVAGVMFPVYLAAMGLWQEWDASRFLLLLGFAVVMAGLVIWRHRSNIARLVAGTEPKIGEGRAKAA